MDLSFSTIDSLRLVARTLANDVFKHVPAPKSHSGRRFNNDFAQFPVDTNTLPSYDFPSDNELRVFCGSEYARITFSDVRLREIEDVDFGQPVVTNKKTKNITIKSWTNVSDDEEEHTITIRKAFSRTETTASATAFGTQITQSLETKIGGSIPGFADAEVTTGLQIQSHFNQTFEKSKEKTDEEEFTEERTFKIKPNTKTTLKREESTSDYTQEVTATGILDAAITIDSDWDFSAKAASFSQLQRLIQGGYVPGAKIDGHINNTHLIDFFRQRRFQNYKIDLAPLNVTVTNTLEYRNISGTDSERVDTPIN